MYCCGCKTEVDARLTSGEEVYPHRNDLFNLPFWKCDQCGNYVGCHHKTKEGTKPLGNIPTKELRDARKHIHEILDPLWKTGKMKRGAIYAELKQVLGYEYHTAEIRTIEEARKVYVVVTKLTT
ncbi:MAG: zinc-finger-containing protein [Desulfobacterales bacterium]